jgi:hypothetical protein
LIPVSADGLNSATDTSWLFWDCGASVVAQLKSAVQQMLAPIARQKDVWSCFDTSNFIKRVTVTDAVWLLL